MPSPSATVTSDSPTGVTLFLLIETGVGGGILIDGKLSGAVIGLSGGDRPHAGARRRRHGSLEQLIGREVLIIALPVGGTNPNTDFQDFSRQSGIASQLRFLSRKNGHAIWRYALFQACRLIDPERIVLGGSVAALYPLVAARVASHMTTERAATFPAPQIVVDEDAEFGSAFGAACLLHQRFMSIENDVLGNETVNFLRPTHQVEPIVRTAESVN